jgi:hypothetical protein
MILAISAVIAAILCVIALIVAEPPKLTLAIVATLLLSLAISVSYFVEHR